MSRLAGIAVLFLVLLLAVPSHSTTLTDALVEVYLTNPQLEQARARLRAVDEDVPQAKAEWRPRLSATSGLSVWHLDSGQGSGDLVTTSQSLDITQPVYSGGRTSSDMRRATAAVVIMTTHRLGRAALQCHRCAVTMVVACLVGRA